MRILADANIELAVVEWLLAEGHDVAWAAHLPPSTPDGQLLQMANDGGYVLLTYDKDFGDLVFRHGMVARGIVLLRFDNGRAADRLASLQRHWQSIAAQICGNFVVLTEDQSRVRPLIRQELE